MVAGPMIDDDNEPAPENLPSTEDSPGTNNNIMGLWTHRGICEQKATIQCNAKPELTFWMSLLSNPSNLNLFKGLFFSSFIKTTILPQRSSTTTSCSDMLWMTTMGNDIHQSALRWCGQPRDGQIGCLPSSCPSLK